jgi:hypothetical protein
MKQLLRPTPKLPQQNGQPSQKPEDSNDRSTPKRSLKKWLYLGRCSLPSHNLGITTKPEMALRSRETGCFRLIPEPIESSVLNFFNYFFDYL